VAYPSHHILAGARDSSSHGSNDKQLIVPEQCLLLSSRGRLQPEQLAAAMTTARRGCEGVAKFVALSLVNSYKVSRL
jgi:hypothetical protein